MRYDAIVIGGGAAGLFCAITAGRRGKRVAVIEHNAEVGRKIIISGGGRCNFTNRTVTADNFVSHNPHFAKSALAGFTSADFIRLVEKHRIDYYEKKLGQLFCRGSSREIVDMLVEECRRARVELLTNCSVMSVSRDDGGFSVRTSRGELQASKLVIACGGLSFPKVGASDLGYRIARQFSLKIEGTRPSLVALVAYNPRWGELAGLSVDAEVETHGRRFRENILFTHRGLSGPAVLQISNYWTAAEPVTIHLSPDRGIVAILAEASGTSKTVQGVLSSVIPARLLERVVPAELRKQRVAQISRKDFEAVEAALEHWEMRFRDTEGWDRAEVTLGGVSTTEIDSKTMECKRVAGLFFIGEVLDVTGWLGGYNFQWAWASGYAAGRAI